MERKKLINVIIRPWLFLATEIPWCGFHCRTMHHQETGSLGYEMTWFGLNDVKILPPQTNMCGLYLQSVVKEGKHVHPFTIINVLDE